MLRHLINAVAIVILFSGAARAQVVAGDFPNAWNAAWAYGVSRTRDPETARRRQEEERKYQTAVKNIPNTIHGKTYAKRQQRLTGTERNKHPACWCGDGCARLA